MTAPAVPAGAVVVRRWAQGCAAALAAHRTSIDALNVFPVADSDTGTNLWTGLRAGAEAVLALGAQADAAEVAEAFGRGCLTSARGNSGAIMGAALQGMAQAFPGHDPLLAATWADALELADRSARRSVADPVEGTMLSVWHAAARAGREVVGETDPPEKVLAAALAGAREALADTTGQLPVLGRAGVVDAGGVGVVLVLGALLDGLLATPDDHTVALPTTSAPPVADGAVPAAAEEFELIYSVSADEGHAAALRAELATLGASVVVAGGPEAWRVHVHLDRPAAALDAGRRHGPVREIRLTSLRRDRVAGTGGLIAAAAGVGAAVLLARAGATVLADPDRPVPAASLAAAARETAGPGGGPVAVLGEPEAGAVRVPPAELAGLVPARSFAAVLAAASVFDPAAPEGSREAMAAAAGAVRARTLEDVTPDALAEALTGLAGRDRVEIVTLGGGPGTPPIGAALRRVVAEAAPGARLVVVADALRDGVLEVAVE